MTEYQQTSDRASYGEKWQRRYKWSVLGWSLFTVVMYLQGEATLNVMSLITSDVVIILVFSCVTTTIAAVFPGRVREESIEHLF